MTQPPRFESPSVPEITPELALQRDDVGTQANALVVTNADEYAAAGTFLTAIVKPVAAEIVAYWKPIKDAAHKAHKAITKAEREALEPLGRAEDLIKSRMLEWKREEDRRQAEERRRRQEEADRLAREQREREEEARLAEAEALEREGRTEDAERVLEEAAAPPTAPPPVVPAAKAAPKVDGIATKKTYSAELVSIRELCAAIGRGEISESLVELRQSQANSLAQGMREAFSVPGLRLKIDETIAAGRR